MSHSQPGYPKADRFIDAVGMLILMATVALVAWYYRLLPDSIPTHFNVKGEPDGHGGKFMVFVLPAIAAVLFFSMSKLLRSPSSLNFPVSITEENAARQYRNAALMLRLLRVVVVMVFAYLTWATIQVSLGTLQGLSVWFLPVVLLLLGCVVVVFLFRAFRLR